MGKNKKVAKRVFKKDPVATKVAGVKKTHTKVVTSNLKRMQFHNKAKLDSLNAEYLQMQDSMVCKKSKSSQSISEDKETLTAKNVKTKKGRVEEPDVDMTADELSKLTSTSS